MFTLYTDGGARGNPGNSACACFLLEDDSVVDFNGKFLNTATNNFAEYSGLILGLELAIKKGITTIECRLDSELVVKQITGVYKISSPEIKKLADKVKTKLDKFEKISFKHVPREENKLADKLVNVILDSINE